MCAEPALEVSDEPGGAAAHSPTGRVNPNCVTFIDESAQCCGGAPSRAEQSDEMLPSRRTQMDSLVQPLVAQYLAMGYQSKESGQNESLSPDERGKDDA